MQNITEVTDFFAALMAAAALVAVVMVGLLAGRLAATRRTRVSVADPTTVVGSPRIEAPAVVAEPARRRTPHRMAHQH